MKIIRKILKFIALKSFNDGHMKSINLGKKLIPKKENIKRILDLGCSNGDLTLEFAKFVNAGEVYGVEFNDEEFNKAKRKGINCFKFDLNYKWNFKDNFFDIILSNQNIEHMFNTRSYLEECYRCLKTDGQVLIMTENLSSWINIFALIFGYQPFSTTSIDGWSLGNPFIWHINEPKDEDYINRLFTTGVTGTVSHIRVLTVVGISDLLMKVGFRNVKVYTRGYLPIWGIFSDLLCKVDRRHGHFLIATGFK